MYAFNWSWKNVDLPEVDNEQLAMEFEAELLAASLAPLQDRCESAKDAESKRAGADGQEVELLAHLGELYSRLGHLKRGLRVDQALVRLRPEEPIFHYNLACSHSRLGEVESAFDALQAAVRLGYHNFEHLRQDQDLDNLKEDERFYELLRQFETG
ncbi:MAG: hypothetical protein AAF488_11010 [Planctomycetota bacterium]